MGDYSSSAQGPHQISPHPTIAEGVRTDRATPPSVSCHTTVALVGGDHDLCIDEA
eukprot:TRINITY_DN3718_c0_g1_i1.p4 TRINITY_DN3718_c0_g1~~TRINITY_DN3718_c0_g1_i1.p4  ORF type:complete len:55 (-),score=13.68 TRINITY_DN3718_c0_g1_i1:390-554(-)